MDPAGGKTRRSRLRDSDSVANHALAPYYATEMQDHRFIETLIEAVEQCVVYSRLQEQEKSAHAELLRAQLQLDNWQNDVDDIDMHEEPALESLVQDMEAKIDHQSARLDDCVQAHKRATELVRESTTQRKRLLSSLFGIGEEFVLRGVLGDVHCEPLQFNGRFDWGLMRLIRTARSVRVDEERAHDARLRLIGKHDDDPADRATTAGRKRLLADYRTKEELLKRRRENKLEQEQSFFLNEARPILVEGGILPRPASPAGSPVPSSLENVTPTTKVHVAKSAVTAEPGFPPQLRRLHEARAKASKATVALNRVKKLYAQGLADYLITYDGITKDQFDRLYQRQHGGETYEEIEAAAAEKVRLAEAECEVAWHEAVEAGVTDLPPSPTDLGGRSEDGRASSCASNELELDRRYYAQRRPTVARWGRKVARAGSPADPEDASRRSSAEQAELSPPGSREHTPGVEVATSRGRVDRYERHRERTRKRAADQEAERVAADEAPAPKRRCIIL